MKRLRSDVRAKRLLLVAAVMCFALIISVCILSANFIWFRGHLIFRGITYLDLRQEELSTDEYLHIREKLPKCEILWNVPIGGRSFSSDSQTLSFPSAAEPDPSALCFFPNLNTLVFTEASDYRDVAEIMRVRPDLECRVQWCGQSLSSRDKSLEVNNPSIPELKQILPILGELESVTLTGILPEREELFNLTYDFPSVRFFWELTFAGRTIPGDVVSLDISNIETSFEEVFSLVSRLPMLEKVNMKGCGLSDDQMMRLADAFPGTFFVWDLEVAGLLFSTDCTEIDLSGHKIEDLERIEAILPYMRTLERVVMSNCGLDDETMDALNRRHEDVRFVWTVYIRWYPIRTDALHFYPYKIDNRFPWEDAFTDTELYPLRYCTDLVSIDIGHLANLTTIEWAAFMPKLRYLIITDTAVRDLTPLSNCKELVYFEATRCRSLIDLTPLENCTALENVNLGWSKCDPSTLAQMPWLHHVWWCSTKQVLYAPCYYAEETLSPSLPHTVLFFDGTDPVDGGWRELQTYYDMRDLMEMFYLR